jgi:hypothetical protein
VIYHDIQQGHVNWFKLRMGKVTASEMRNLLTPKFEHKKGEAPRTYCYEKLAESWRDAPLISTGSWATEQGQMREEEAIPFLAIEKGWHIKNGGFIESDDGLSGCSPDGLVGDDLGIEVKCPEPTNMVRWLMEGVLPDDYAVQVHTSMYVTGFDRWIFLAYNRGFPALIVEVHRERAFCDKIKEAIERFHANYALGWDKLKSYK